MIESAGPPNAALPPSHPRLARLARRVLIVEGALASLAALAVESLVVPGTNWRLDGRWGLALGAGLMLASVLLRRGGARLAISLTVAASLALGAFAVAWRPPARGDVAVGASETQRIWVSETEWFDNYTQCDPHYGYRHRAHAAARHHHRDFDVVYHTDAQGWRVMPAPTAPVTEGDIALVGCSFTFGFGMPDDAMYPALLAAHAWPHRRVRNLSAVGWGTGHVALVVADLLAGDAPPACILYGWITKHSLRNDLRRTIRASAGCPFPFFELEQAAPRYRGLLPVAEATLEESPELREREHRISVALIEHLAQTCEERGVPFYLLALEREHDAVLEEVFERGRVSVLDASRVSDHYLTHDEHPGPIWHRRMARALARMETLALRLDDPSLRRPEAIARVDEAWSTSIDFDHGADARLSRGEMSPVHVRVEPACRPNATGGVELRRRVSLRAGEASRVDLWLRSDAPRTVEVLLGQAHPPWKTAGEPKSLALDADWRRFVLDFAPAEDWLDAKLAILLGANNIPVEVRETRLLCQERDLLAEEPEITVLEAGS